MRKDRTRWGGAAIALAFALCFIAIAGTAVSVYALSPEVQVSNVTRLTHPVYRASNMWYGVRDPWNRDFTRMMLYENPSFTDPGTGKKGRGLVWGFQSQLRGWKSLSEYESAAKPIDGRWPPTSAYWSPFPGEENIIYGLYTGDKTVSKLNVDTGARTVITSYNPGDGTDVSKARSLGWTADNTLIVNFNNEENSSGGYEVDVRTGTKKRYSSQPSYCSAEGWRWPPRGHGHSHRSDDRSFMADYSSPRGYGIYGAGEDCNEFWADGRRPKMQGKVTHVTRWGGRDWFLGGDIGQHWNGRTKPHIDTYGLYQIFFDRKKKEFRYRRLFSVKSAGRWKTGEKTILNYQAIPVPTLRKDGRQVIFMGTDGKFTFEDNRLAGAAPWGHEGIFAADLEPAVPD